MNKKETACLCGHPKLSVSSSDEGHAIMLQLEAIKARRSELIRELVSITVKEDQLRSRLTSMHHAQD